MNYILIIIDYSIDRMLGMHGGVERWAEYLHCYYKCIRHREALLKMRARFYACFVVVLSLNHFFSKWL